MPLAPTVFRLKCVVCGQVFETTAHNAECCSVNCRKAKHRAKRKAEAAGYAAQPVVSKTPARAAASAAPTASPAPRSAAGPDPDAPDPNGVLAATIAAIPEGATPWKRAVVVTLAQRLDNSLMDNASSVAVLSKRYEDAMADLLAESAGDDERDPWDTEGDE